MGKILTQRELEVLQSIFNHDGDIDKVAADLSIDKGTVQTHLYKKIYNKLHVNTLAGATRTGQALKLIDLTISIQQVPPLFLSSSPEYSSAVSNSNC